MRSAHVFNQAAGRFESHALPVEHIQRRERNIAMAGRRQILCDSEVVDLVMNSFAAVHRHAFSSVNSLNHVLCLFVLLTVFIYLISNSCFRLAISCVI